LLDSLLQERKIGGTAREIVLGQTASQHSQSGHIRNWVRPGSAVCRITAGVKCS